MSLSNLYSEMVVRFPEWEFMISALHKQERIAAHLKLDESLRCSIIKLNIYVERLILITFFHQGTLIFQIKTTEAEAEAEAVHAFAYELIAKVREAKRVRSNTVWSPLVLRSILVRQ